MTEPPFRRLRIVGAGLIGTSIGQAARRAWPTIDVVALDAGDDLSTLAGADLLVLAAPVRANIALLAEVQRHLTGAAVVTDTGSTKRAICEAAAGQRNLSFIGGHPMAGAAKGGAANARPDLFDGRPWVLTPAPGDALGAVSRLETFVTCLGAVPHVMTPE